MHILMDFSGSCKGGRKYIMTLPPIKRTRRIHSYIDEMEITEQTGLFGVPMLARL